MNTKYIPRIVTSEISELIDEFPAVAILGPRQCGKSTLAKQISKKIPGSIYLDLENPVDIFKLSEPYPYFTSNANNLICLDEIQLKPDIFKILRSVIDESGINGQFLILGSASRELIKQSSESLAGRIIYTELTPFLLKEAPQLTDHSLNINTTYWLRGGFPRSYLASSNKASNRWRISFIKTFLERDIPQLGFNIPADNIRRLWQMLSHLQGQVINLSQAGGSLGLSHTTIRSYLDLLENTFMIRMLKPYHTNIGKRLVKSPKVYIRDTGILHALLSIGSFDELWAHPVIGASWETMVIENIIQHYPDYTPYYYRTAAGAEIDLVMIKGLKKIAFECKVSQTPTPTKGFWNSLHDLNIDEAYIIAPIKETVVLKNNVKVVSLSQIIKGIL